MNRLAGQTGIQNKQWWLSVMKRANFSCQYPGCKTPKDRIQAHHVKPWSKYPSLRFNVDNGIVLCHQHHKQADRANHNNYGS